MDARPPNSFTVSAFQTTVCDPICKGRYDSTVLSTSVPWPALRHELACEERAAVVADQNGRASMMTSQVGPKSDGSCFATLAPNVRCGLSGQNLELEGRRTVVTDERDLRNASKIMDTEYRNKKTKFHEESSNARDIPLAEYLSAQDDPFSYRREDNESRSPSASWKTAITARVNSLWKSFHERSTLPMPIVDKTSGEYVERTQPPLVELTSLDDLSLIHI